MERILRSNKGYSFAEVVIAMVIMGIVALLMGTILTTSTKMHRSSFSSDDAYAIAREKLAEFQNDNIAGNNGSDNVTRNKVNYQRSWTINKGGIATDPVKAVITVSWTMGSTPKTISITGYVECLSCIDNTNNNAVPTNLIISSTSVTKDANTGKANAGTAIGAITATDNDPGDILFFSLKAVGTNPDAYKDNDKFIISNDTLKTKIDLSPGEYKIAIEVKDCQGTGSHKDAGTFSIEIQDIVADPTIDDKTFNLIENNTDGATVGTLDFSNADQFTIISSSPSDEFDVSPTGVITVKSGKIFNHETADTIFTLNIQADHSLSSNSDNATITINITNDWENATAVNLSNNTVLEGTTLKDVGTFSTIDHDEGHGETYNYELCLNPSDPSKDDDNSKFNVNYSTGLLQTASTSVLSANNPHYITVKSIGSEGNQKIEVFEINAVSSGIYDPHDDGNVLTGPGGLTWFKVGSRDWTESGGTCKPVINSTSGFLIADFDCGDGTLTVNFKQIIDWGNGKHGGVIFRYQNSSSYYFLYPDKDGNSIWVNKNSINNSGGTSFSASFSGSTKLEIVMAGSNFTFKVDGSTVGTWSDADYATGKIGYAHGAVNSPSKEFYDIKWEN